ncbi:MAG: cobalamin biosynthesis protein CobW [Aestuariivita sp.]|nr:cobalamin biosynthesis protein CobW [Aestuariivita sp.]MCY4202680.1 cobalamin biosynthesis protein CobW [Aestuariivita sp.]
MTDISKRPVTLITGFLGAGKTTLIQNLIAGVGEKILAVIVNEFGDVGVDGDLLKGCKADNCPAENIIELTNGCICCTVADDFIPTIETLMQWDPIPDHIVIETSGLALPKPLLQAFDWPSIRSKVTVDGVIALADAEAIANGRFASDPNKVEAQREADDSLDHDTPLSEVFEDQIACADMVLLTKSDLARPETIIAAKSVILQISDRNIPIVEVTNGVIDPQIVLGLEVAAENDIEARRSHHDDHAEHDHDDFGSVVIDIPEVSDPLRLINAVRQLARDHKILRTKGFAIVSGKPMRLQLQGVGERVRHQFDRPWEPSVQKQGRLVLIAEQENLKSDIIREFILSELNPSGKS